MTARMQSVRFQSKPRPPTGQFSGHDSCNVQRNRDSRTNKSQTKRNAFTVKRSSSDLRRPVERSYDTAMVQVCGQAMTVYSRSTDEMKEKTK